MKTALTGVLAALLLAGCATPYSEAPLATNFPTEKQQKLQAASHWLTIADDVATRLSASLPQHSALHVQQAADATPFQQAFTGQLITSLISAGHTVLKTPDGALNVEVETQAIAFAPDRPQYRNAGTATALSTGLWALYEIQPSAAGAITALAAANDATQWFRSEFATGATPQTEIIVTSTVSDVRRLVARSTSVYYVADHDSRLYRKSRPATHNFPVKDQ